MKCTRWLPLALLAVSTCTWADDGWYVVGEVTHARDKLDTSTADAALTAAGATALTSSGKHNSNKWRLQLGYQVNSNFAVEAGYIDFGKVNYSASYAGGAASGTAKAGGIDVAALGILPLTDSLSVFGKAGLVAARVKSDLAATGSAATATGSASANVVSPLFGLGLDYKLNPAVDLRAEYDHASNLGKSGKTGKLTADMLSVGLAYHF